MNITEYKQILAKENPDIAVKLQNDIMFQFSKVLMDYRDRGELSYQQIADEAGLERSAVVRHANGTASASIKTLQKFVDAGILKVSITPIK